MKKNPYNFNEIPTELKNLPQWVLGAKKREMENRRRYHIKPTASKQANRRTWSTFATAGQETLFRRRL
ncbi:hypothetical protein ACT7C6_14875 [Bacillus paranthracis]